MTFYRTAGAWGAGLDRNLHDYEFDQNNYDFATRIAALEDGGGFRGIDDIRLSGDQLFFDMTDYTTIGPLTMPEMSLVPRGQWQPSTTYFVNDLIYYGQVAYVVIFDHTSDSSTFDPGDNDGSGHDFYEVFVDLSLGGLPTGGTVGQALFKSSTDDFVSVWDNILLSSSLTDVNIGTTLDSDVLVFNASLDQWTNEALELDLLSDVVITSPLATHVLRYDGFEWANSVLSFTDMFGVATPEQIRQAVTVLGTTGTVSLDPTIGDFFTVTPAGGITLNAASAPFGKVITIKVLTSGTSSFNITPTTNFKSTGALATGTVSAKTFTMRFIGDGTNMLELSRTAAM